MIYKIFICTLVARRRIVRLKIWQAQRSRFLLMRRLFMDIACGDSAFECHAFDYFVLFVVESFNRKLLVVMHDCRFICISGASQRACVILVAYPESEKTFYLHIRGHVRVYCLPILASLCLLGCLCCNLNWQLYTGWVQRMRH